MTRLEQIEAVLYRIPKGTHIQANVGTDVCEGLRLVNEIPWLLDRVRELESLLKPITEQGTKAVSIEWMASVAQALRNLEAE